MNTFARQLGRWPRQVVLMAEAWWELARASWEARRVARNQLLIHEALGFQAGEPSADTAELAAAVARASRCHLRPMRCLERSLALCHMLRRRDIPATLRIGCRRDEPKWRFHAWVEDGQGRPVGSGYEKIDFHMLLPERWGEEGWTPLRLESEAGAR